MLRQFSPHDGPDPLTIFSINSLKKVYNVALAADLRRLQMADSAISLAANTAEGESCMSKNCGMELFTEHTPPNLEQLFGYQRHNRWVAFFWGRKIDHHAQGYGFDGEEFNPINPLAWDTFFNHPLIVAMNHRRIMGHATKRFEFGDEHQQSKHCLLLDRRKRCLHVALKAFALEHLRAVSPSADGLKTHSEPLTSILWQPNGKASSDSKGELQRIAEMATWLDRRQQLLAKKGQWPILR